MRQACNMARHCTVDAFVRGACFLTAMRMNSHPDRQKLYSWSDLEHPSTGAPPHWPGGSHDRRRAGAVYATAAAAGRSSSKTELAEPRPSPHCSEGRIYIKPAPPAHSLPVVKPWLTTAPSLRL